MLMVAFKQLWKLETQKLGLNRQAGQSFQNSVEIKNGNSFWKSG
jgi:hypothetical protein